MQDEGEDGIRDKSTGSSTGTGTRMERNVGREERSGIVSIKKEAKRKTRYYDSACGTISVERKCLL